MGSTYHMVLAKKHLYTILDVRFSACLAEDLKTVSHSEASGNRSGSGHETRRRMLSVCEEIDGPARRIFIDIRARTRDWFTDSKQDKWPVNKQQGQITHSPLLLTSTPMFPDVWLGWQKSHESVGNTCAAVRPFWKENDVSQSFISLNVFGDSSGLAFPFSLTIDVPVLGNNIDIDISLKLKGKRLAPTGTMALTAFRSSRSATRPQSPTTYQCSKCTRWVASASLPLGTNVTKLSSPDSGATVRCSNWIIKLEHVAETSATHCW